MLLIIFSGCNKDSINEPLIIGNKITAAYNYSAVEALAITYSDGLKLISIKSDNLDFDGYANNWSFRYTSGGIAVDYCFHTTSEEVKYDSITTKVIGTSLITHQWFNSNEALKIAEKNGGRDFRTKLKTSESLLIGIDANTGEVTLKYP